MVCEPVDKAVWGSKLERFRRGYERHRLFSRLSLQSPAEKEGELALLHSFFEFTGSLNGRVLDIGCGDGFYRPMLSEAEYVGVDPLAWNRRPMFPFLTAMGEALPFRSGCFHHVLIITSLDHAQDPERFIAEGRRVLRSGGMLSLLCGLEGEGTGVVQENCWQKLRSEGVRALVRGTITRFYQFAFRIQDTHPYEFTEEKIKGLMVGCFSDFESKLHSPNILFLKGRAP